MKYQIYCEDCIVGAKEHIKTESVDLLICDPPFGINESSFDKHYKRKEDYLVINGYVEAPKDYYKFTHDWMSEAKRVLKPSGSFYIISGWSKLRDILNVVEDLNLHVQNHIVWKYNFGVFTRNKFVTSHYHILYVLKNDKVKPTFNTYCRFGSGEKNMEGKSLNYQDMEDVWIINKEFHQNRRKNKNKLPLALVEKMILYSSNEGDTVCDFFQGNFTTAVCAIDLGRVPMGFELNIDSYDYNMPLLDDITFGNGINRLRKITTDEPSNSGKKIIDEERSNILKDYDFLRLATYKNKKDIISELATKYGRGKFSILNIINAK